ncbi:unnamed protein product, partial [marine sediment metagenome]
RCRDEERKRKDLKKDRIKINIGFCSFNFFILE